MSLVCLWQAEARRRGPGPSVRALRGNGYAWGALEGFGRIDGPPGGCQLLGAPIKKRNFARAFKVGAEWLYFCCRFSTNPGVPSNHLDLSSRANRSFARPPARAPPCSPPILASPARRGASSISASRAPLSLSAARQMPLVPVVVVAKVQSARVLIRRERSIRGAQLGTPSAEIGLRWRRPGGCRLLSGWLASEFIGWSLPARRQVGSGKNTLGACYTSDTFVSPTSARAASGEFCQVRHHFRPARVVCLFLICANEGRSKPPSLAGCPSSRRASSAGQPAGRAARTTKRARGSSGARRRGRIMSPAAAALATSATAIPPAASAAAAFKLERAPSSPPSSIWPTVRMFFHLQPVVLHPTRRVGRYNQLVSAHICPSSPVRRSSGRRGGESEGA